MSDSEISSENNIRDIRNEIGKINSIELLTSNEIFNKVKINDSSM